MILKIGKNAQRIFYREKYGEWFYKQHETKIGNPDLLFLEILFSEQIFNLTFKSVIFEYWRYTKMQ